MFPELYDITPSYSTDIRLLKESFNESYIKIIWFDLKENRIFDK